MCQEALVRPQGAVLVNREPLTVVSLTRGVSIMNLYASYETGGHAARCWLSALRRDCVNAVTNCMRSPWTRPARH